MRYHNITKDDMLNGDGLRVVLWVSGCSHRCVGCQNPITWDEKDGLLFDGKAKEEIFQELKKEYVSGVTFSGGDPLYPSNVNEITLLAREIKEMFPQKTIWLYTGALYEEIAELEIMKYVDVCVDGEYVKELGDTKLWWKGSSNQRVIDVVQSNMEQKVILYCDNYGNEEVSHLQTDGNQINNFCDGCR